MTRCLAGLVRPTTSARLVQMLQPVVKPESKDWPAPLRHHVQIGIKPATDER